MASSLRAREVRSRSCVLEFGHLQVLAGTPRALGESVLRPFLGPFPDGPKLPGG
jgi:hypothetical protein